MVLLMILVCVGWNIWLVFEIVKFVNLLFCVLRLLFIWLNVSIVCEFLMWSVLNSGLEYVIFLLCVRMWVVSVSCLLIGFLFVG